MKSERVSLKPGESPAAVLPPVRGEHEPGARVLSTWQGHPDDVPLGLWEHVRKCWVTRVEPVVARVVMTPDGRVAVLEATVYGFDYEG